MQNPEPNIKPYCWFNLIILGEKKETAKENRKGERT